jgi:class 3 adenylate cyclase
MHRERRLVSALFCDLVGSTALGERLDPEILQLVLGRYFDAVRGVVERHGGRVEKFIGDAVAALFGFPTAHEDDAVRAARAALDLQAALDEVNADLADLGVVLAIRVGIQSGDVIVDPASKTVQTIGGNIFNTAARLQAAAAPGVVLIGAGAAELLAGWADLKPVPPTTLRGKQQPEHAFVLTAVGQNRRARGRAPFVGRSRQLDALRGAFRECVEDNVSVLVTLLGVPGIGKSRIVERLGTELASAATVLVASTPTYGEGVSYAPVVGLLRAATSAVEPEAVVAGLRAILGSSADAVAVVDRLASLVRAENPSIGGDTAWGVRRLLESMSAERPVVVVVEDIHFGGDSLLELIDRIASSLRGPILVLCTARPELLDQRPSWGGGKPRAISISLGPLPARESDQLAMHLLVEAGESARRRLTAFAEGNPLYLEQFAAMVAEGSRDVDTLQTPPSIRAVLAARLDRLDPVESRVVDLAAVEGRHFHPEVITVLDPDLDPAAVREALERLENRSLVTMGEAGTWLFAHALIRDAATRRTAKDERAALHVRLAEHLAEYALPADEVIGVHLERAARLRRELGRADPETAELERQAGRRFAAAGSLAYASLDLTATAELLGRAAALLPAEDPDRTAILPDLGVSLMEIGHTDEAEQLLRSADLGAAEAGEVLHARIRIQQLALQGVYRAAPDNEITLLLEEGRSIVHRLELLGDQTALAEGWVLLEYLNWVLGRVSESADCCVRAVRAAQAAGRMREQLQAGGDLGLTLSAGFLPAEQVSRIVSSFSAERGPVWRLVTMAVRATACAFRGDLPGFDSAQAVWAEYAEVHGLEWPQAEQYIAIAQARLEVGDAHGAEQALRTSMDTTERLGDLWAYTSAVCRLPRAVAMQGLHEGVQDLITRMREGDRFVLLDRDVRIHERFATALSLKISGRLPEAEVAARSGVDLAQGTDLTILHTVALEQLADIVEQEGRPDDATQLRQESLTIHHRVGNRVGATRILDLLGAGAGELRHQPSPGEGAPCGPHPDA